MIYNILEANMEKLCDESHKIKLEMDVVLGKHDASKIEVSKKLKMFLTRLQNNYPNCQISFQEINSDLMDTIQVKAIGIGQKYIPLLEEQNIEFLIHRARIKISPYHR
jgi:hypothetical protein